MTNIFPDEIPLLKNSKEFEEYVGNQLIEDLYFLASACVEERRKMFEELYKSFDRYGLSSSHFFNEIRSGKPGKFHQRTWEMYIANILYRNNFTVKKFSEADKGIDFVVEQSKKKFYLECNAKRPSKKQADRSYSQEIAQRVCGSITEKNNQYIESSNMSEFNGELPYVVAINLGDPDFKFNETPQNTTFTPVDENIILEVLFDALVEDQNRIAYGYEEGLQHVPVRKQSFIFAPESGFFRNKKYSNISAIWFSKETVLNQNITGDSNMLILNPFAKNELDINLLNLIRRKELIGGNLIFKDYDIYEKI